VTNIRISLTKRCNLACPFCHQEGDIREHQTEMTPNEIQKMVSTAAALGVDKVKLTGGEPLLRKEVVEIISLIHAVPGISDIGVTTNGILLGEIAEPLKDSGLNRVNISLGTLKRETYRKMTGLDSVETVLKGVCEAARVGLKPVKLNMVVLKGVNDDQVWEMLEYSRMNSLVLQLIEVESDSSDGEYYKLFHRDFVAIDRELESRANKVVVRDMQHRRKYFLKGGGEVEVVQPMHNTEFCGHCNRMRLTSDGKLKPCLFRSDNLVDILTPLRKGASEDELKTIFKRAVELKKPYFT
jgi:cyclic pyranopterin phosphate synthase